MASLLKEPETLVRRYSHTSSTPTLSVTWAMNSTSCPSTKPERRTWEIRGGSTSRITAVRNEVSASLPARSAASIL